MELYGKEKKMTRQEEILKAGEEIASNPFELEGFIEGAEWADEHPDLYSVTRKAIEREREHLIDKVCKWLDKEMEDYVERFNDDDVQPIVISGSYDYKKDLIEAFRKAMEQ